MNLPPLLSIHTCQTLEKIANSLKEVEPAPPQGFIWPILDDSLPPIKSTKETPSALDLKKQEEDPDIRPNYSLETIDKNNMEEKKINDEEEFDQEEETSPSTDTIEESTDPSTMEENFSIEDLYAPENEDILQDLQENSFKEIPLDRTNPYNLPNFPPQ